MINNNMKAYENIKLPCKGKHIEKKNNVIVCELLLSIKVNKSIRNKYNFKNLVIMNTKM